MALNVSINLPGMITVNYPLSGQVISSHARISGSARVPAPATLPAGTDFILAQITDPTVRSQVMLSHQLRGKQYLLTTLTYYLDGNAFREVDYTADEISAYSFNQDYLPSIVAGEELSPGPHTFTVVARFFSDQNPGVELYDLIEIPFSFDATAISIRTMLDRITPGPIAGQVDMQMVNAMLDYVLTQRTEGALKNDIDYLQNLYDLDNIPSYLLPYLAKTIGYDYFAGLLGDGTALREELRFLPDWQKSAGTEASILTLLRPLLLDGKIVPLYLDLIDNILVSGVQQRYQYSDTFKVVATTKSARFTFPLTQSTFVPNTSTITITAGGLNVFTALWDVVQSKVVVTQFHDGTGSPSVQWLIRGDGTHATIADVDRIFADHGRGGITIVFNQLEKAKVNLSVEVSYQFDVNARPRRNTRLSEFFDCVISSSGKPNAFEAIDYNHVYDIIKRSKPLRTKLRQITFPLRSADAYLINPFSVSSTGTLANLDRITAQNIATTAVQLNNPVRDSVSLTQFNRVLDGFTFSWENQCDRWENRFGIFHSLALEPTLLDQPTLDDISADTLLQRGYAAIVQDDSTDDAIAHRERWLRRLGLRIDNPKSTARSQVLNNQAVHYYTLKLDDPVSPAVQTYHDLVMAIDDPQTLGGPTSALIFCCDVMTDVAVRHGFGVAWDGGTHLQFVDFDLGTAVNTMWTVDTTDQKSKTVTRGFGSATLSLYRFRTQSALDAFLTSRPNLNNVAFTIDATSPPWYAVWDVTANFFTTPIHLSTTFDRVTANFQDAACCLDLATVSGTSPNGTFNSALGTAYQNGDLEVDLLNVVTEQTVARYQWNGSIWLALLTHPDVTVTLDPAGSWTMPMAISGSIHYTGPAGSSISFTDPAFNATESANMPTTTYTYRLRACVPKVGDVLVLTPMAHEEDDFAAADNHNGQFDVIDDSLTYLGGLKLRDLFAHEHDQAPIRQAADETYLRSDKIFPSVRMTVKIPLANDQLDYDGGEGYDEGRFYDAASGTQQYVQYLHFPKRVVVQTVTGYTRASAPFLVHD